MSNSKLEDEKIKERAYIFHQILEVWKETCEHFGLEYNEDDIILELRERKKDE